MAKESTIPKTKPKKKKIVSKRLSIPKPKKSASSRSHDRWYKKLFSDPMVVEDLLRSFVKEDFVKKLNFNSIQKVNTEFVSPSGDVREADMIYKINADDKCAYVYLFLEFQSTVDKNMVLRMARYMLEFYQDLGEREEAPFYPPFPILLYTGEDSWNAPTRLQDIFTEFFPAEFVPSLNIFKIAIRDIPKAKLVRMKTLVSAIFYVEKSTPNDIKAYREELNSILVGVVKKNKKAIKFMNLIIQRLLDTNKIKNNFREIKSITDLLEATDMLETAVKRQHEELLRQGKLEGKLEGILQGKLEGLEEGIEQGIERGLERGIKEGKIEDALKLIKKGMKDDFIQDITDLSLSEIKALRNGKKLTFNKIKSNFSSKK